MTIALNPVNSTSGDRLFEEPEIVDSNGSGDYVTSTAGVNSTWSTYNNATPFELSIRVKPSSDSFNWFTADINEAYNQTDDAVELSSGIDVTNQFRFSCNTDIEVDGVDAAGLTPAPVQTNLGATITVKMYSVGDKNRIFKFTSTEFIQSGIITIQWSLMDKADQLTAFADIANTHGENFSMTVGLTVKAKHMRFQFNLLSDLETMLGLDPSYGTFNDYDFVSSKSVCNLDVSATKFNDVFLFRSKDALLNSTEPDMEYACNSDNWHYDNAAMYTTPIPISHAEVNTSLLVGGTSNNNNITENQIKFDLIRHIAKEITGGYASSDVFANETELIAGVESEDANIDTSIRTKLNNGLSVGGFDVSGNTVVDDKGDTYYYTAANNVDGIFELWDTDSYTTKVVGKTIPGNKAVVGQTAGQGVYDETTANISRSVLNRLLTANEYTQARVADIYASREGAQEDVWMSIPFIAGDSFVMKVNYKPNSYTPLGTNGIDDYSYKVVLNLV
jgi:hypothetical protein